MGKVQGFEFVVQDYSLPLRVVKHSRKFCWRRTSAGFAVRQCLSCGLGVRFWGLAFGGQGLEFRI